MVPQASLKRVSGSRLEIKDGGGCLMLFGMPFLTAGLFVLGIGLGIVPLENADDLSWWGQPLLLLMGLAFTAVGGVLVFGRSWTIIDKSRGTISRMKGLLVPMKGEDIRLAEFEAVEINFQSGDSDSADSYPIELRRTKGADLKITSSIDYGRSRQIAAELATFLGLPLEDNSSDHKTVLTPSQAAQPLAERLRDADSRREWATRPFEMRSQVDFVEGGVRIRIPNGGFRWTLLLPGIIPLAIAFYFAPGLLELFEHTDTPPQVGWFFLAFIGLFFVAFPLVGAISAVVTAVRGYTEIIANSRELRQTVRTAWKSKVTAIAASEIVDLDYSSLKSLTDRALLDARDQVAKAHPGDPAARVQQLPKWVNALARLAKSKGVSVKHSRGILVFGAGLSDDEVKYLYTVTKQALAGK